MSEGEEEGVKEVDTIGKAEGEGNGNDVEGENRPTFGKVMGGGGERRGGE